MKGPKVNTRNGLIKAPTKKNGLPAEAVQFDRLGFYFKGLREGKPSTQLVKEFQVYFDASESDAMVWRQKAMDALCSYVVKDSEKIRAIQYSRLEHILNIAVENNQLKTAQSIIDTMNKLMGLYKEDVIIQPVTQFNFADMNTAPIVVTPEQLGLDRYPTSTPEEVEQSAQEIIDDIGF